MKIRKRSGPSIDPCGTPFEINLLLFRTLPPGRRLCVCLLRILMKELTRILLMKSDPNNIQLILHTLGIQIDSVR